MSPSSGHHLPASSLVLLVSQQEDAVPARVKTEVSLFHFLLCKNSTVAPVCLTFNPWGQKTKKHHLRLDVPILLPNDLSTLHDLWIFRRCAKLFQQASGHTGRCRFHYRSKSFRVSLTSLTSDREKSD